MDGRLRTQMQISWAIDELFGNSARYAYPEGSGQVTVQCGVDPETRIFTLVLRDRGIAFNPLDVPEPDTSLPAQERRIGGLGVFLARKAMDELTYHREGDFNVLCARKKI